MCRHDRKYQLLILRNIIVPPLAALLYIGAGKHPVAGMICGYAGANAGFTANLMVAGARLLLRGSHKTTRSKASLPETSLPGRCYL
ncbi:MAG: AbgT family transporter [Roseburia sp.]